MDLETFMLADHAVAAPDGKLYINGGGITKVHAPTIPFGLPFLSIVVRFRISRADAGEHSFAVRLEDPNGVQLLPPDERPLPIADPDSEEPDEEHYLQIVTSFGGLPLMTLGTYTFVVALDGKPIHELKLPVVPALQSPDQSPS